jgi:glutathione S-transferase
LLYFGLRGRAELIRLVLHVAQVEYKTQEPSSWPEDAEKTPFGKLPVWTESDGWKLAQSQSIVRYLAKKHGLTPSNERDAALVESIQDHWVEIRDQLVKVFFEKNEDVKAKKLDNLQTSLKVRY